MGFSGGSDSKESAYNAGDLSLIPGSGRFPWRRKWLPTPVFLPGEFHGQRSLGGLQSMELHKLDTNWVTFTHDLNSTMTVLIRPHRAKEELIMSALVSAQEWGRRWPSPLPTVSLIIKVQPSLFRGPLSSPACLLVLTSPTSMLC